jgi:putative protease
MPYELLADGKPVPLGDRKYLLSPQDLAGLELLPELVRLGVASFKIEGRLKSPEYVANITRIYRTALDSLLSPAREAHSTRSAPGNTQYAIRNTSQYELEMAFSRGLYTGWFEGINNQKLVHGRFGKKRGVYLGEVARIQDERVSLKLQGPLKLGDGIVFDAGHPEEEEEGGRIYALAKRGDETWLSFGHGAVNIHRVHVGDKLWKTSDPALDRRLRQSYEGDLPRFRRPIQIEVHGQAGSPLTVIVRDELGHLVRLDSTLPLTRAENQPLTTERLQQQLGRLGGTPFELGELKNSLTGDVLLPVSELNRLRREFVSELETQRAQPLRWTLGNETSPPLALPASRITPHASRITPHLTVLVRTLAQLEAALANEPKVLYCDFENPKKYREAVELFRSFQAKAQSSAADAQLFVAPPRIFKMGEEWTLKQVRSCEADGYLVRNYDHLRFFADARRVGDYSLNIANRLSAEYFKNQFGLERVTASYDLNFTQLEALLQGAPPDWFEITIHQHMPMFHMEHCVFCAFLSKGTDYTNCGRPCDLHDLKLRDRVGAEHPVKADVGCRNTVFNALAQTGADYVARMLALGVRYFRLEFLNESPEQVAQTIRKYRQLLRGEITGQQLWSEFKLLNQLGVTRGQMGG